MLLLLQWLESWNRATPWVASLELIRYITFRVSMGTLSAFMATLLLGPLAIRMLQQHCPERIVSDSEYLDRIRQTKQRTPTMGGLFLLLAIAGALLLWGDLSNRYVQLALLLSIGLGIVGGIDDWIKLKGLGHGLSMRAKLLGQLLVIVPVTWLLNRHLTTSAQIAPLVVPLCSTTLDLGGLFVPIGIFVMVASSNAVNLTDGLDGLAGGCLIFACSGLGIASYLAGHHELAQYLSLPYLPGSGELAVTLGAVVGAVLGFLWFNCYPAQVFMGDTGSLSLGGLLGFTAVAIGQEALLVLLGGIFVVEAASVLAQVYCYRWQNKRVLLCAPLHHHFQFKGWHETKIVVRFWIASALLAVLAMASLKIRS